MELKDPEKGFTKTERAWIKSVLIPYLKTIKAVQGNNCTISNDGTGQVINADDTSSRRGGGGGGATGACCVGTDCSITTESACDDLGGSYQGDGSDCDPNPCVDCTICDDLQPTNPSGVPVHINIVRTLSGSCGTGTVAGSMTYDADLGFFEVGPVGGHLFCGHNIFDNGFDPGAWTGEFTCNGSLLFNQGFPGLLGRDTLNCSWYFDLDAFTISSCGGCGLPNTTIFQLIFGPGNPTGIYMFSETLSGLTLATVVTIT